MKMNIFLYMKYSKYTSYLVSLETVASGKAVGTMKK